MFVPVGKFVTWLIGCCCVLALALVLAPHNAHARPYILVDAETGAVLAANHANIRWHPASVVKMMTAYTVFRALETGEITLQSPVRISQQALAKPPTKMGFPLGTIMNIDNALKMMLVKSANDVAVALAEAIAGNEPAFVGRMNRHAEALGMRDTHLLNTHGLHEPGQYTSAFDLALLAMELHRNYRPYLDYFSITAIRHGRWRLRNHNPLLERFAGATGMKTGYLCASGLNIVASAQIDGRALIAVVLGARKSTFRNIRAARLLSDGFATMHWEAAPHISSFARVSNPVSPKDISRQVCRRKTNSANAEIVDGAEIARRLAAEQSLVRVEDVFLTPRIQTGTDAWVKLGGASGPSPVNIQVVNGSAPQYIYPVPTRRPSRLTPHGDNFAINAADDNHAILATIPAIADPSPVPKSRPDRLIPPNDRIVASWLAM